MEGNMVEKNQEPTDSWVKSLNSIVIKYFKDNLPSYVLSK